MSTPKRPEWADRIIRDLITVEATGTVHGQFTDAESDLLFAIVFRIRHRVGETGADGADLGVLAARLASEAVREIAAEAKRGGGRS